jgi:hypothetical protein
VSTESKGVMFELTDEDVQEVAAEEIGRRLTEKELQTVRTAVEKRFDCWYEFVCNAIEETTGG